jgi:hypothetical protein
MSELKLSITILVSYIITLLGIANIERFEQDVLDLTPAFFIIVAIVVFSELILVGILIRSGVKLSNYAFMAFWVVVYILLSFFSPDSIFFPDSTNLVEHIIQVLLIILTSFLAYDVGRKIGELDKTLEGLSSSAYPSRVRDIQTSRDLISAEITRSRRYHHPLSVLTIRLQKPAGKEGWKELDTLASDMIDRFAIAKVGQMLSNMARSTDMILQDRDGQFVLLCPETNISNITSLAERMSAAVEAGLNTKIDWGSAAFPDEALTFDDLIYVARGRSGQTNLELPESSTQKQ